MSGLQRIMQEVGYQLCMLCNEPLSNRMTACKVPTLQLFCFRCRHQAVHALPATVAHRTISDIGPM